MINSDIKNIIESILFVAEKPLAVATLKNTLDFSTKEIREALKALADEYNARGGGFHLCEVAGGWQIRSRPEYRQHIIRMIQANPRRLSKAALETLSIVAWNEPVIRSEIEKIRGVDSGGVLRLLLDRKLIRILGRREIPGRPMIYATTKFFLEVFDLNTLKDLPTLKEVEKLEKNGEL
ncbi:SMC-Scp complex subunit ScpB [Desulfococcaceae bacterium HSG9]|nr:SMC-Scp complex subunit ScpB [Desulfococcaceae bacterium HSG9]